MITVFDGKNQRHAGTMKSLADCLQTGFPEQFLDREFVVRGYRFHDATQHPQRADEIGRSDVAWDFHTAKAWDVLNPEERQ